VITVTDSGAVRTVTINRPERRNAIDDAAVTQLREVVRITGADPAVRALIVTGEGDVAFCAGSDLKAAREMTLAQRIAHARNGQELMDELHAVPVLTIAAVEGWALGGGLELALACDLIVAAESGKFGLPEVQKATIPSWGGTHRLTRAAGLATAKNMLLGGRIYSAAEAHAAGWVLAVVADGQAHLQAAEVAALMCQESSRDLLATAKELLNAGAIRDPQASSAAELAVEEALASQEGYGQPQGRSAT
jgi:enoyl-CoA hydratase